jgi:hypothetical protein
VANNLQSTRKLYSCKERYLESNMTLLPLGVIFATY